ncbi:MAG: RluA family pseudouridine synthase [Actinobacteria bacterium]|nr:MAG: RluA family pseudouridine synthase [Actinomycetota bacterium]
MSRFTVSVGEEGQRLDRLLAGRPDVASRSAAQRLISEGHVAVNNDPCAKRDVVRAGDVVSYHIPPPREVQLLPQPMELVVRHEDPDLIVISKPAGVVVHPSHGHDAGTIVNALLHICKDLSGVGGERRPGIVHRLDKDTSGLMLAAKNDEAHLALSRQLKRREIKRTYIALVWGTPKHEEGIIDAPIGRSARDRKRMAVVERGRHARTRFRVVERLGPFSLLELSLETGRTHQIRVHLAHIGHAIVGDRQYGPPKKAGELGLGRQFLHAARLELAHPRTGDRLTIEDPLPPDLEAALAAARKRSPAG